MVAAFAGDAATTLLWQSNVIRKKTSYADAPLIVKSKKHAVTVPAVTPVKDSYATAHATTTGRVSVQPDRDYNPKSPGSNWQPIRKTPTTFQKLINRLKGHKK